MLLTWFWTGCAEAHGLPDLALHAASTSRVRHSASAASRSWDLVLWADVSFRLGSEASRLADSAASPPDGIAADSCTDASLCEWESSARSAALVDLQPAEAP